MSTITFYCGQKHFLIREQANWFRECNEIILMAVLLTKTQVTAGTDKLTL